MSVLFFISFASGALGPGCLYICQRASNVKYIMNVSPSNISLLACSESSIWTPLMLLNCTWHHVHPSIVPRQFYWLLKFYFLHRRCHSNVHSINLVPCSTLPFQSKCRANRANKTTVFVWARAKKQLMGNLLIYTKRMKCHDAFPNFAVQQEYREIHSCDITFSPVSHEKKNDRLSTKWRSKRVNKTKNLIGNR